MDGPTGKVCLNLKPTKKLVMKVEKKDGSGSSSSSSENFVAEKDGKFVIPVPGPCKWRCTIGKRGATCSRSSLALFLFEKGADRALIGRWFERANKIAKPFGEDFRPKFPVVSHAGREDVMAKESMPPFPEIPVHHSINMMKMDALERFQELVSSMEKSRSLFH